MAAGERVPQTRRLVPVFPGVRAQQFGHEGAAVPRAERAFVAWDALRGTQLRHRSLGVPADERAHVRDHPLLIAELDRPGRTHRDHHTTHRRRVSGAVLVGSGPADRHGRLAVPGEEVGMLADLDRDTGVDDRVVGVGDEQARLRARGDRDRVRHPVRPGHLGTGEQTRVERAQRDGDGLRVPVLGSRRFRLGGHTLGRQDFGGQTGADRPGGRALPGGIVGCGEHDRHDHRGGQDQDQPVPLFPEPAG